LHSCGTKYKSNISERGINRCPKCKAGSSKAEKEIADWLQSLGVEIIRRDRTLGIELDIFIPSAKTGIEFDGTYWHSSKFVNKANAVKKLKVCENHDIRLFTIQEHLWVRHQEKIKNKIKHAVLPVQEINKNEFTVQEIDVQTGNNFLGANHIDGKCNAKTVFAIVHNSEIVSVMAFVASKKFAEWELLRFETKPNINSAHAGEMLLTAFKMQYSSSIVVYSDRHWTEEKLYKALGFKFLKNKPVSCAWVRPGISFAEKETKNKNFKSVLLQHGFSFNPDLNICAIMHGLKFTKVYDKGCSIFVME